MTCWSCAPVGVWFDLHKLWSKSSSLTSKVDFPQRQKKTFYINYFNPGQTLSKPNNPHISIGFLNSTRFSFHSERPLVGWRASRPTENRKFMMMSLNRVWCKCCIIKQEENHSECIVIKGLRMWLTVFLVNMLTTWCCTVTPCSSQHFQSCPVVASFPLLLLF